MENSLKNVKEIIVNNLKVLKQADAKCVKNIESFFEYASSIPLIKLYTEEGVKEIEDKLYNTDVNFQSDVIEFLLRIKPDVMTVDGYIDVCQKFLISDKILEKMYIKNDNEENEFTKLGIYSIQEFYILNLILAYNTVIL